MPPACFLNAPTDSHVASLLGMTGRGRSAPTEENREVMDSHVGLRAARNDREGAAEDAGSYEEKSGNVCRGGRPCPPDGEVYQPWRLCRHSIHLDF